MTAIVIALVFSLFVAYFSVSSVWFPHGRSDDVFRQQNRFGDYAGAFPLSELSYPFSLSVYHTPFIDSLTFDEWYAYGQVGFSTLFAGTNIVRIEGTFWYFYPIEGASPLQYRINFLFSEPLQFFGCLLVLFTLFNFIGALLGFSLAYAIAKRLKPIERTSNPLIIPKVGEDSEGTKMKPSKAVALIPAVLIGSYFYFGVFVWNALLSSFSSHGGREESMSLFVFILWVGFGFLVCYFLGLIMIAILARAERERYASAT
jgi:hypothetical protein